METFKCLTCFLNSLFGVLVKQGDKCVLPRTVKWSEIISKIGSGWSRISQVFTSTPEAPTCYLPKFSRNLPENHWVGREGHAPPRSANDRDFRGGCRPNGNTLEIKETSERRWNNFYSGKTNSMLQGFSKIVRKLKWDHLTSVVISMIEYRCCHLVVLQTAHLQWTRQCLNWCPGHQKCSRQNLWYFQDFEIKDEWIPMLFLDCAMADLVDQNFLDFMWIKKKQKLNLLWPTSFLDFSFLDKSWKKNLNEGRKEAASGIH